VVCVFFVFFPILVVFSLMLLVNFLFFFFNDTATTEIYTVASGVLTQAGAPMPVGSVPSAITVDPSENFVYIADGGAGTVSVFSLNATTGALTLLNTIATGAQPFSLLVSGMFLYVGNAGSTNISAFSVDSTTGLLTQITSSPFGSGGAPSFMLLDPKGRFLYVGSQGAKTVSALTIDASTGALTLTGQSATTNFAPGGMALKK
jgi:6-phosphogluconolactonase (cycloisomerase 2 family)